MKKATCFVLGSLVGGGIAGFIGLFGGMVLPFVAAENNSNHCIAWKMNVDGNTTIKFYGNRDLFPELNREEENSE